MSSVKEEAVSEGRDEEYAVHEYDKLYFQHQLKDVNLD